ncbi:MAG TPA: hypothetical protein VK116_10620 [Planctomycetota bacterium]|nr:hypothetical protein [Planctomycetota bacterium]
MDARWSTTYHEPATLVRFQVAAIQLAMPNEMRNLEVIREV